MQMVFVRRRRKLIAAIENFWTKFNQTDPRHVSFIFCHHADRFIMVTVHLETLLVSQIKIGEHMAT